MRISKAAFDLIVAEEVSSKARYEKKYRGVIAPGASSGPTVGIGYDLKHHTPAQIRQDWAGLIPDWMIQCLVNGSGKDQHARFEGRNKINIPWDAALANFQRIMPIWESRVAKALPNTGELSADSFGALVSLTYNRGASYNSKGDRYREMRDIKAAMASRRFDLIPNYFRSMKRLWPTLEGLKKRRDREADLFARGLRNSDKLYDSDLDRTSGNVDERHIEPEAHAPITDKATVMWVQGRFRELGYYSVGEVDGEIVHGGRTEEAILAYRRAKGLPLTAEIDDDLLAELQKPQYPRPVSETRATATATDVIEKVPAVKAAWRTKIAAAWAMVTSVFMGILSWIADQATDIWEQLQPVIKMLGTIPLPLWFALVIGIVGFMYWQSRNAVNSATEEYREGRLL